MSVSVCIFLSLTLLGDDVTDLTRWFFLCTLYNLFTLYDFFFEFLRLLEIFYVFIIEIFVLRSPVVAVIDLARWIVLCTLYNWFARPILFIFFRISDFFNFLYQFFRPFISFFNKWLRAMNFLCMTFILFLGYS